MEVQGTPFPEEEGKSQPSKPRTIRKAVPVSAAPKGNLKEPVINRQRRVFGTIQNPNVQAKPVAGKPAVKTPSTKVSPKQPQQNPTPNAVTESEEKKKSPEKNKETLKNNKKNKSVGFEGIVEKKTAAITPKGDEVGDRTPVARSPSLAGKPRVSGTPYWTAERCSNCRFDKLETSSYWLGQIKLAEPVGKHFVSVVFFRLALESNAEPIRNLRVELKRYLARHERLSAEPEWRDVSVSYGLTQAESDAHASSSLDQPQNESAEQPLEQQPKT